MIRTKYISKVKRERQAFRESQPCGVPVVDDHWRKVYPGGREELNTKTEPGAQLYRARTLIMAIRQDWKCGLTGEQLTYENVTFDHEFGRGMGSSRQDDRIVLEDGTWINAAVTYSANLAKGSKRVPYLPHARRAIELSEKEEG